MTVVIGEFEILPDALPTGGAATSGAQQADQRAEHRRMRMALARSIRMART